MEKKWLLCPICEGKTRIMIRDDTLLKNFVLFCPKCKHESLIDVNQGRITIQKSQTYSCRADS